jgi:integrase
MNILHPPYDILPLEPAHPGSRRAAESRQHHAGLPVTTLLGSRAGAKDTGLGHGPAIGGMRPAVAVWTVERLATFLMATVDDSLFALWWLIGLRGLRRGEACGLRWTDIDLDHRLLFIVRNRTTAGYQVVEGPPKTAAGTRAIALDKHTVKILREHRRRQLAQRVHRIAAGKAWHDSGHVFVRADGSPIHPGYASGRFRLLVRKTDVPPIRLHDLRHGAASLAHEAGADLKTLQDLLGHSSIVVTADTYTSVLPLTQRRQRWPASRWASTPRATRCAATALRRYVARRPEQPCGPR